MKKIIALSLLLMFVFCGIASARVKYDSKGHIIYDDTIRGQRHMQQTRQMQGAAAARINYGDSQTTVRKGNYKYSNRSTMKSNLKSNYYKKN